MCEKFPTVLDALRKQRLAEVVGKPLVSGNLKKKKKNPLYTVGCETETEVCL